MNHTIDAKNKPLGRIASEIALLLQGKHDPSYRANRVSDDQVVVKNVGHVIVTGGKLTQKKYYRHTGYMGHLKSRTFEQEMQKSPERVLREAVRKMLPKNSLNKKRLQHITFEQ